MSEEGIKETLFREQFLYVFGAFRYLSKLFFVFASLNDHTTYAAIDFKNMDWVCKFEFIVSVFSNTFQIIHIIYPQ